MSAHTLAFDTLKFAKNLERYTFTTQQAEGLADELKIIIEENTASSSDIDELEKNLATKIEISAANTRAEIIKWVVGLLFAQSALIVSAIKFL